jgi:hypothetical protein
MRNVFLYKTLVVLSFFILTTSCTTDDDGNPNNSTVNIAQVEDTAETGTWRVTNMVDSGVNETADFAGYEFSFNPDGSLVATNGTITKTGTWSVTNDDSDNDVDFNIFFPVSDSDDFDDLNDDWDIVSYTSSVINLRDVDDNSNDTDLLTFERN